MSETAAAAAMPYFATGEEDLLSPSQLGAMSGLDFIRGIRDGKLPAPPIAEIMGMRIIVAEEGQVIFEGLPAFAHYNPIGSVHGGWYGTMLDSCMACAVQTTLPQGKGYTTLEYKVNILRAATARTGPLRAEGTVSHSGRRTGVAEGRIVDDAGRIYATGSTTCLILDLPGGDP